MQTVRAALDAGRVDLYLQAVVSLPQRRTQYYESFTRLRDETGRVLMPAEFLSVAEPGGLVAAIDNLLLFRCVQIVRRLAGQDRKVGIFCNISLASLGDEDFFPQFMEFLGANRDLAGSLIFELGQNAFNARGSVELRNMAKLAELGFRFSLDKVSDLDLDFQDLARADVCFVKLSAPMLIDQLEEHDGRLRLRVAARHRGRRLRGPGPPPRGRAGGGEGGERAPGGRYPRPRHRLRPGPPVRRAAPDPRRRPGRDRAPRRLHPGRPAESRGLASSLNGKVGHSLPAVFHVKHS